MHGKMNNKRVRAYDYDKPEGKSGRKEQRRNNRSTQKAALKRYCC